MEERRTKIDIERGRLAVHLKEKEEDHAKIKGYWIDMVTGFTSPLARGSVFVFSYLINTCL